MRSSGAQQTLDEILLDLHNKYIERIEDTTGTYIPTPQIKTDYEDWMEGIGHRRGGNSAFGMYFLRDHSNIVEHYVAEHVAQIFLSRELPRYVPTISDPFWRWWAHAMESVYDEIIGPNGRFQWLYSCKGADFYAGVVARPILDREDSKKFSTELLSTVVFGMNHGELGSAEKHLGAVDRAHNALGTLYGLEISNHAEGDVIDLFYEFEELQSDPYPYIFRRDARSATINGIVQNVPQIKEPSLKIPEEARGEKDKPTEAAVKTIKRAIDILSEYTGLKPRVKIYSIPGEYASVFVGQEENTAVILLGTGLDYTTPEGKLVLIHEITHWYRAKKFQRFYDEFDPLSRDIKTLIAKIWERVGTNPFLDSNLREETYNSFMAKLVYAEIDASVADKYVNAKWMVEDLMARPRNDELEDWGYHRYSIMELYGILGEALAKKAIERGETLKSVMCVFEEANELLFDPLLVLFRRKDLRSAVHDMRMALREEKKKQMRYRKA